MTTALDNDTIAALATAPGRGGVGIIRISGPKAKAIAQQMSDSPLTPRYAHYGSFYEVIHHTKQPLDQGLTLYFPGPNSFTGEDVVELQGHGGPVILDCLLREVISHGARLARPGEFSERAYLNDKIDLAQAEAIADLIDSASEQAARGALRSLQGEFSQRINTLLQSLINLRIYVEAAIDFPEEEIDFLADGKVANDLASVQKNLTEVMQQARQGSLLSEGMTVVIAGKPNAGKSSLLNSLSGKESAIVTDIAGTTRDVLREQIQIDGMPLHIIDTAGLRESADVVEQIGIDRAWSEIEKADRVLLVVDSTDTEETDPHRLWPDFFDKLPDSLKVTVIQNKCDLSNMAAELHSGDNTVIRLSAKDGIGIELLRDHLKQIMGFQAGGEGSFTARRRHITALNTAEQYLQTGADQLLGYGAGELLAEDLRLAQNAIGEITGQFTPDDLLGKIFSSFCIGK
ncbi:tRNA modification GTPase MnmE [Sinobacterium norvegicum]|uniref:tRNA modification GTPase MnmE n=1 Tax=Sinobacterium norvegicum TaxID=1641715 RepID=A0ABM9AIP6_9GAMM|nr:tRNA uridine-5-carboxymethylaminomethyl(34) synthesis GTPase MnmE [Sinobacterium norvegicum]CAH0993025.1 tRNA modification GTPase MnmE [Sinobacterium norvegicum]